MGLLDEFFATESYDHPRLRFWRAMAQKSGVDPPTVEVVREFDGLSYGPAELYVTFTDSTGAPVHQDREPWDARLDLALMEQGWRAPAPENEAARFELALKHLFSSAESRFGDGFFSSVLVVFVAQSAFAKVEAIRDLLTLIREPPPSKDSPSASECAELIKSALAGAAQMLKAKLKYPQESAEAILVRAMVMYLDARFSITSGRNLGLYAKQPE